MKDWTSNKIVGFGVIKQSPRLVLHIANRPPLDDFQHDISRQLKLGEAASIIQQTGNHWRKVFSILAKMSFALFDTQCKTWQEYRDTKLLTEQGFEFIAFSSLTLTTEQLTESIINLGSEPISYVSLVCGLSYAQSQLDFLPLISHQKFEKLKWSETQKCLVTPYFDWRQLNNDMLDVVISIIKPKLSISTLPS